MKKLILILLINVTFLKGNAQIVFCPPGAEWHYVRFPGADAFPGEHNEAVKYTHDTLVDATIAKVLKHLVFFVNNTESNKITLIKQIGDTVFMRNAITQHAWQILYNFNASVGQGWTNTLTEFSNASVTYTTTLDSIKQVTVNGFNLKRMFVKRMNNTDNWVRHSSITERLGSNVFLFDFYRFSQFNINIFLDAGNFHSFLCYQDSVFGLKQFTNKPCNYSNLNGVTSAGVFKNIQVFPNPVSAILNLEIEKLYEGENIELILTNAQGQEVKRIKIITGDKIDMSNLSNGIYHLSLRKDQEIIYSTKIIKED